MKKLTEEMFNRNFKPAAALYGLGEDSIVTRLRPVFEAFDPEKSEFCFTFLPDATTKNPWDAVHGGVICTLLDTAMGFSARTFSGRKQTPTVSMQVSFLRPHLIGKTIRIRVTVLSCSAHICAMTALTTQEGREDPCATATASFFLRDEPLIEEQAEEQA